MGCLEDGRLLQGPVYGLDTSLTANETCGIVSNPMEHGEAAKTYLSKAIALSQQLQQPETELGARTYYLLTLFVVVKDAPELLYLVLVKNQA